MMPEGARVRRAGVVHRNRAERAGPAVDTDLHILDFVAVLLRAAQSLQRRVVDLGEKLHRQRVDLRRVQKRDLGTGIEDEDEPAFAIDHAAHGGAEVIPEKILIGRGHAIGGGEVRERGLVAAEVELDARLLQQMRAEEKLDRELVLAGDDELHLVVRHDRHRHILDDHPADLQRIDDPELDLDRLAEKAGEVPSKVPSLRMGTESANFRETIDITAPESTMAMTCFVR